MATHFAQTGQHIDNPRELLDSRAVECMISGYAFVDELIEGKIDIFSVGQSRLFLEMNALVLCGRDDQVRLDYATHLAATEKHFYNDANGGIRDVIEWNDLHTNESAWLRAAGVYIRILSEPELFIEGNHRTGALVMSYILGRDGFPPCVLTIDHAKKFCDWSELFTSRHKASLMLRWQMPRLQRQFAQFLQAQAEPKFLRTC